MKRRLLPLVLLAAFSAMAADEPAKLTIALEPLGDTDEGVVTRAVFRVAESSDVPPQTPLVLQGSVSQNGAVLKTFRFPFASSSTDPIRTIQTFPPGEIEIEARVMVPLEESAPVIVTKTSSKFTVAKTGRPYVASESDGAEAILAEGIVPEVVGAVRILTPRRDVAPNLFIVDVETKAPVKRVEFFVEGKKIMARNAPPYRAELDLGALPKRVEVRAVGYDARGRYVDADAFIVNERETPLEVKITRTVTPDNISHIKLSIQNPKNTTIRSVVLFAEQKKIIEWTRPPYAIDIPNSRLQGVEFLRASVMDETNYEASDLIFLSGARFSEEIEVNVVELPVMVTDAAGVPIGGLKQENFTVLENGLPQKIASFNYASNLPISVGLLIDHSGSMKPRMKQAKEAALAFLRNVIKSQDKAFVGGFAFDATKLAPFATEVSALYDQVEGLPEADGGTSLYDAVVTGLYRFRGVEGRKALIIVTDGEDSTSRTSYEQMLTYARSARIPLYFLAVEMGFGEMIGSSKIKALAAETGGVAYFVKDVKQLKTTYDALEGDLRSQYFLAYNTETSRKDQRYRTVEVKVDRPDAKVRTIRGYIP